MWHLVKKHLKLIIFWGVALALLSGLVSLFFPRQYSAISQVLIISRDRSGVDPYTQVKSAERIGENLAQIMQTTDFYNKVMEAPASFDRQKWQNFTNRQRRKQWVKDVQGAMTYGTSLLQTTVYGNTSEDALALASAVNGVLTSRGWEYVGGDIAVKAVNDPLVSRLPARPNFILNTILGFIIGFLLASLWIVRYKKHTVFGV